MADIDNFSASRHLLRQHGVDLTLGGDFIVQPLDEGRPDGLCLDARRVAPCGRAFQLRIFVDKDRDRVCEPSFWGSKQMTHQMTPLMLERYGADRGVIRCDREQGLTEIWLAKAERWVNLAFRFESAKEAVYFMDHDAFTSSLSAIVFN